MSQWPALLLGLAGWILLPGLAASRFVPARGFGELRPVEVRLAATLLFGQSIWVLVSGILARLGILTPDVVWTTALALGLGSLVVIGLARRPRSGDGAFSGPNARALLTLALTLLVTVGPRVIAALAAPWTSQNWKHWWRTLEVARAGAFPSVSFEWGLVVPFFAEYNGFHAASAVLVDIAAGFGEPAPVALSRVLAVTAAHLGFWVLVRRWCSSLPLASAGLLLFNVLNYYAQKYDAYRAEGVGFGLMFVVPVFALSYLSAGNRASLVAALAGFAALSQVHGVAFVFCGILVAALALPEFLAGLWSRSAGWRRPMLLSVALVGAWLTTDVVISHRLTQFHMALAIPKPAPDGTDKTWLFDRHGRLGGTPPSAWDLIHDSLDIGPRGPCAALLLVTLAATIWLLRSENTDKEPLRFAGLVLLLTFGLCIFFTVGWSTYVPRRTALNRFLGLAVGIVPFVGASAADRLRRLPRGAILSGVFLAAAGWAAAISSVQHQGRDFFAELRSFRPAVGAGRLVLTNGYSSGLMPAVLGVPGLLDGRGPYHDEALMDRANRLQLAARRFFAKPREAPFDLYGYHVTHVLVGSAYRFDFETDLRALRADERLRQVRRTRLFVLFKVRPRAPAVD